MVHLIIAGQEGVGKRTLAAKTPRQEGDGVFCTTDADSVWRINNKYFQADVHVEICDNLSGLQAKRDDCEGLILVFSASDVSTFTYLEQWVPFIEEIDPAVLICVANKSDLLSEGELESATEAWQDWSLDHGLELVVCSARQDEVDSSRDAEGLTRIFEAVSNHTWSGLTMKNEPPIASSGQNLPSVRANGTNGESLASSSKPHAGVDYSKFDAIQDEDPDSSPQPKPAPISLKDLPRPAQQPPPLELDSETEDWIALNAPSEEELEALRDLHELLTADDARIVRFFKDSAALQSLPAGPNATAHVNHAEVLPKLATAVVRTNQILKDEPSLLRLGVRLHLWGKVAACGARMEEVVPAAVAWAQLETCAAETTVGFFKRVTLSREALSAWADEALVPAVLRGMQAGCGASDYLREVLCSAAQLKEGGNALYREGRLGEAGQAYAGGVRVLEQLYVHRDEVQRAARRRPSAPKEGKFAVETVEEGGGEGEVGPAGPDGWPRFLLGSAREMTVTCYLNMAQAALRQGGQEEAAVQYCTYALALDPSSAKGYYRRGLAFMASRGQESAEDAGVEAGEGEGGAGMGGAGRGGAAGERRAQPPRGVLASWAIRDLEKARELAGADKLIEGALAKAKAEFRELERRRLRGEAGSTLMEAAEGEGAEEEEEDMSRLVGQLRAARADGQGLTDAQRRERAAMAAKQAAAFLGMEDEEGESSSEDGGA